MRLSLQLFPRVDEIPIVPVSAITQVLRETTKPADFESAETVEGGFEVVKNDGVGEAFKHESQFPEGIDADWEGGAEGAGDGADVEDDEDDADEH